ncbi:TetR/AcrR family transcriptional regulator C-terminal domain-containing protein [Leucobacter sp. M11]|uniref:TetR/AcrR family transcriptional regulator C-terminal domain-containing protein n=1 Tax=Leucobacter sp. M11 TaxID=2993565 RepID=UPI002D7F9DF4|nr:TetR/AcrR family transcriptional regulator C-terminal domain-containing protein [Leucobacter sp. M11]MEB4613121.1 TetR/AcrR family transcriptional regulator C-terminal domain-containing protein [Leucobacter sp. M11]
MDDLVDLALDHALGADAEPGTALASAPIAELMLAMYRHLTRHPWSCQVIALRAPCGPHYGALSERICVLLEERSARDALGTSSALSNFVLGSATTAQVAARERSAPVDPERAPTYARLHAAHSAQPEELVAAGIRALLLAA